MTESAPWRYAIPWVRPGAAETRIRLVADQDVRARVAKFLDIKAIDRLEADVSARVWRDGMALAGRINAEATRTCGVTLELFQETIDTPFEICVVPEGSPNAVNLQDFEIIVDIEADDPPDSIAGDSVDLAGYIVEALALALDPFPRKPGAVFEPPVETTSLSPFAILRKL